MGAGGGKRRAWAALTAGKAGNLTADGCDGSHEPCANMGASESPGPQLLSS